MWESHFNSKLSMLKQLASQTKRSQNKNESNKERNNIKENKARAAL